MTLHLKPESESLEATSQALRPVSRFLDLDGLRWTGFHRGLDSFSVGLAECRVFGFGLHDGHIVAHLEDGFALGYARFARNALAGIDLYLGHCHCLTPVRKNLGIMKTAGTPAHAQRKSTTYANPESACNDRCFSRKSFNSKELKNTTNNHRLWHLAPGRVNCHRLKMQIE
jgi:hypothetical protein